MKKHKQRPASEVVDRRKSLQQLEGADWGEPPYPSHLVTTVYALRRKPIGEFTVEDLRIMLGQQIGAPFLVPLALERLADDVLVSGDFYEGDLLKSVIRQGADFWGLSPHLRDALETLFQHEMTLSEDLDKMDDEARTCIQERLIAVATAYERWQEQTGD